MLDGAVIDQMVSQSDLIQWIRDHFQIWMLWHVMSSCTQTLCPNMIYVECSIQEEVQDQPRIYRSVPLPYPDEITKSWASSHE